MTLDEVIKRAENETGGTVSNITDCGDMWALSFLESQQDEVDNHENEMAQFLNSKTGSAHILASKIDDTFKYCSAYDYIQSVKSKLPEDLKMAV